MGASDGEPYRSWGFEPGESIYSSGVTPEFEVTDILASLGSTYDDVKTINLVEPSMQIDLNVVITKAEVRYHPIRYSLSDSPSGSYRHPDWYLEGWIPKSGFDQFSEVVRLRIYVRASASTPELEEVFWQVIPKEPRGDFVLAR